MRLASLARGKQLTPGDLKIAGEMLFGEWGWQTRLAEALEVDGSTVRRWISGVVPAPHPTKVAIRLMLEQAGYYHRWPTPPLDKRPAKPRT